MIIIDYFVKTLKDTMNIDFSGKVVIVTGASSGIGAEAAKLFAEYNAKLTLVGRNEERLLAIAKACEAKSGLVPIVLVLNLVVNGSCKTVIDKTIDAYRRIDVLVNCAGKLIVSTFDDQTMAPFDEMISINLRVPYELTMLAYHHLRKTKGNVINITSAMSQRYRPGFLPYTVSKAGLERFTSHAAAELVSEGIRVNTISPGVTRTNILESLNVTEEQTNVYNSIAENLPHGKIIEPKEVATLICVTASDLFPNVNGSSFTLDFASCMI